MTTTIHLRISEETKEKYYQKFYSERSKNTKLDHDEFLLNLLAAMDGGHDGKKISKNCT